MTVKRAYSRIKGIEVATVKYCYWKLEVQLFCSVCLVLSARNWSQQISPIFGMQPPNDLRMVMGVRFKIESHICQKNIWLKHIYLQPSWSVLHCYDVCDVIACWLTTYQTRRC